MIHFFMDLYNFLNHFNFLGGLMFDLAPKNLDPSQRLDYEANVGEAVDLLPKLQTGLDVNVKFSSVSDFEYTKECIVFDLFNIALYHGWLVDPQVMMIEKSHLSLFF